MGTFLLLHVFLDLAAEHLALAFDRIHFRDGGIVTFMDSPQIDLVSEMARALKPGGVFLSEIMHVSKRTIPCPLCFRLPLAR